MSRRRKQHRQDSATRRCRALLAEHLETKCLLSASGFFSDFAHSADSPCQRWSSSSSDALLVATLRAARSQQASQDESPSESSGNQGLKSTRAAEGESVQEGDRSRQADSSSRNRRESGRQSDDVQRRDFQSASITMTLFFTRPRLIVTANTDSAPAEASDKPASSPAPHLTSSRVASGEFVPAVTEQPAIEAEVEAESIDTAVAAEPTSPSNTPESLQLVSLRVVGGDDSDAIDTIATTGFGLPAAATFYSIDKAVKVPTTGDISTTPPGVATTNLDRLFQQVSKQQEEMSDLEELLDTIAAERSATDTAATLWPTQIPLHAAVEVNVDLNHPADHATRMILLEAGAEPLQSLGAAQQPVEDMDFSDAGQWSAGIGFFQAFEDSVAESIEAPILMEGPPLATGNPSGRAAGNPSDGAADRREAKPNVPSSPPTSSRALGVVACLFGVHYLRNRRGKGEGRPDED